MKTAKDRFDEKFEVEPNSGCWLWTGYCRPKGHGMFRLNGRMHNSHRIAYEMYVAPIPEGLIVHHTCRTPQCVNPEHLMPLTLQEHAAEHERTDTHCKKGHPWTPENTYIRPGNGKRRCRDCRSLYNFNKSPHKAQALQDILEEAGLLGDER